MKTDENQKMKNLMSVLLSEIYQKSDRNTQQMLMEQFKELFPAWEPGVRYKIGACVVFGTDVFGNKDEIQLWQVNCTHIADSSRKPGKEDNKPGMPYYTAIQI